jgi:hypothetical protein
LWLQKSSNGELADISRLIFPGDLIGFTRDTLQQLNSKNALRLIKKTNLFKTTIKRESCSLFIGLTRVVSSSQSMSPNSSAALDVTVEALDHDDCMRKMITQESNLWTREHDTLLIEV